MCSSSSRYHHTEEEYAFVSTHHITILSRLLPRAIPLSLEAWDVDDATAQITLHITSMAPRVPCPSCTRMAQRVHSCYTRTLADLPWGIYEVTWKLRARKFFCDNRACRRQIFTERLPDVATPWARRTVRLAARAALHRSSTMYLAARRET